MAVVKQKKEKSVECGYEESIKTLRANLQLYEKNVRTILFTSACPGEGKSSISFYLAQALAQSGKKTILVDADIRNSVLMARYEIEKKVVGLSQYLSGLRLLEDVIYGTEEENLNIIFACPNLSQSQPEFFDDELCQRMFEALKANYDYVIVDTASMETAMDGKLLAQYCDGVILVVESGAVNRRTAQKAQSQLESVGARILGVVLNKAAV